MRIKTYVALAGGLLLLGALYVPGCGDNINCGAGTVNVDGVCIPEGADQSVGDLATKGVECGTNTALSTDGTKCEVATGACLNGTVFDAVSKNCHIPNDFGTELMTTYSTSTWFNVARINPAPADGGSMYQTLGLLSGGINVAGVMDTDLVFMAKAPFYPLGVNNAIPVIWGDGTTSTTRTAIDHQFTIGEMKKCVAVLKFYKDPPEAVAAGKKYYKEVIDLSGCVADMTYAIWNVYSNSGDNADRTISTPAGGLPNFFITNGNGQGHWERNLDPMVWLKSGVAVGGTSHAPSITGLPDLTTYPNASLGPYLTFHNFHQSNGNAGFCERDPNMHVLDTNVIAPNTLCVTPPSNKINLPGLNQVEIAITHYFFPPAAGLEAFCSAPAGKTCSSVPLSMLQPF